MKTTRYFYYLPATMGPKNATITFFLITKLTILVGVAIKPCKRIKSDSYHEGDTLFNYLLATIGPKNATIFTYLLTSNEKNTNFRK